MESILPYALLGMALLVFCWVMLRLTLKRGGKRKQLSPERQVLKTRQDADKRGPRADKALGDAPAEILRWQVEMTETARDLRADLDSRLALLNATIRLSDQRIAEMKKLLEQIEDHTRDSQR